MIVEFHRTHNFLVQAFKWLISCSICKKIHNASHGSIIDPVHRLVKEFSSYVWCVNSFNRFLTVYCILQVTYLSHREPHVTERRGNLQLTENSHPPELMKCKELHVLNKTWVSLCHYGLLLYIAFCWISSKYKETVNHYYLWRSRIEID